MSFENPGLNETLVAAEYGALLTQLDEGEFDVAGLATLAARVGEAQLRRDGWIDSRTAFHMKRVLAALADAIESCEGDLEAANIIAIPVRIAWDARTALGRPCMPGQFGGPHDWEHVTGSDSLSKCKTCDWVIGK